MLPGGAVLVKKRARTSRACVFARLPFGADSSMRCSKHRSGRGQTLTPSRRVSPSLGATTAEATNSGASGFQRILLAPHRCAGIASKSVGSTGTFGPNSMF